MQSSVCPSDYASNVWMIMLNTNRKQRHFRFYIKYSRDYHILFDGRKATALTSSSLGISPCWSCCWSKIAHIYIYIITCTSIVYVMAPCVLARSAKLWRARLFSACGVFPGVFMCSVHTVTERGELAEQETTTPASQPARGAGGGDDVLYRKCVNTTCLRSIEL